MKALVIILLLVSAVFSQEEEAVDAVPIPEPSPYEWPLPEPTPVPTPVCDHESNSAERFASVRLLPPLKIKNFDPHRIEYLFEDKVGIHVGALYADEKSVMPKDIWKEYKDTYYWILYCEKDNYIYTIVAVAPWQLQKKLPTPSRP